MQHAETAAMVITSPERASNPFVVQDRAVGVKEQNVLMASLVTRVAMDPMARLCFTNASKRITIVVVAVVCTIPK